MRYLILMAMIGLTGCATTGKYEEILQSWVGKDSDALLVNWGAPTNVQKLNSGNTLIEYRKTGATESSYNEFTRSISSVTYWCNTRFIVNQSNKIQNWSWEGNACRAR